MLSLRDAQSAGRSAWRQKQGASRPSFPRSLSQFYRERESSFLLLDSGSRPAALPGMTGCHECPARVEDFVSEQEPEATKQSLFQTTLVCLWFLVRRGSPTRTLLSVAVLSD